MEYELGRKIGEKIVKAGAYGAVAGCVVLSAGLLGEGSILMRAALSKEYSEQLQTESSSVQNRAERVGCLALAGLVGAMGSLVLVGAGSLIEKISRDD